MIIWFIICKKGLRANSNASIKYTSNLRKYLVKSFKSKYLIKFKSNFAFNQD